MPSTSRVWTRQVTLAVATVAAVASSPAAAQRPATAPLTPFARLKAEALLRDRLPCLGCHTIAGEGGRVGPDLTRVGERRPAAYIAAMVADPQRVVPGTPMPRVSMPDETRSLIVRYLQARRMLRDPEAVAPAATAIVTPAGAAPTSPSDTSGAVLYAWYCAACHGAAGAGDGPNASALPVRPTAHASAAAMAARPDDSLFDTIHGGGWIMNRSPRMPGYGLTLSRPQIRALVRHIRALCRGEGPAWANDGARPR